MGFQFPDQHTTDATVAKVRVHRQRTQQAHVREWFESYASHD